MKRPLTRRPGIPGDLDSIFCRARPTVNLAAGRDQKYHAAHFGDAPPPRLFDDVAFLAVLREVETHCLLFAADTEPAEGEADRLGNDHGCNDRPGHDDGAGL